MKNSERSMLKDIICYVTPCYKCAFSPNCNWKNATDEKLAFLATEAVKSANPKNKKTLLAFAKEVDVQKYLMLKTHVI